MTAAEPTKHQDVDRAGQDHRQEVAEAVDEAQHQKAGARGEDQTREEGRQADEPAHALLRQRPAAEARLEVYQDVGEELDERELRVDAHEDQRAEEDDQPEARHRQQRQRGGVGHEHQVGARQGQVRHGDARLLRKEAQVAEDDQRGQYAREEVEPGNPA